MKTKSVLNLIIILSMFLTVNVHADVLKGDFKIAGTEVRDNSSKILNPLWEKYESLTEQEKKQWTVTPEKYVIEYTAPYRPLDTTLFSSLDRTNIIPSSFDLRNVNGVNYITTPRNQNTLGLCWAFASNSSVESNILIHGLRDVSNPVLFSESQLDYASAYPNNNKTIYEDYIGFEPQSVQVYEEKYNPYSLNRRLGDGGNFSYASLFYGIGLSPAKRTGVWENYIEYTFPTMSLSDVFDAENEFTVTDYISFPYIDNLTASENTKVSFRNMIKKHVMENGSVYVSTLAPQKSSSGNCYIADNSDGVSLINWQNSCEEESGTTLPYNGTHAMSIVGWKDDYSAKYCAYPDGHATTKVSKSECETNSGTYYEVNGAWILKNSWGSHEDFIYLAYDSYIIQTGGVVKTVKTDYDNSYAQLGPIYEGKNSDYSVLEIFYKPVEKEILKRISFETETTTDVTYEIYISNWSTSEYELLGSIDANLPGRYSLDIDDLELYGNNYMILVKPSKALSTSEPYNIYAFTENTTEEANVITIFDPNYVYNSTYEYYQYYIMTRANNVPSGSRVTYKFRDKTGNDITSDFAYANTPYIVNGSFASTIITYRDIRNTIIYVDTYIDGQLLTTNNIAIGENLDGDGSSTSPFIIDSIDDLDYLLTFAYSDSYYKINTDLDFTNQNYNPIGLSSSDVFTGYIDGGNHDIIGLKQDLDYTGLFYEFDGTLENLNFKNADLTANKKGGVISANAHYASIKNVKTEGILRASNSSAYIGGFTGETYKTNIEESYNRTKLDGDLAGAFVGYLGSNSTIKNSFNIGIFEKRAKGMSTLYAVSSNKNINLEKIIDYTGNDLEGCQESAIKPDGININDVYYYSDNRCTYLGQKLDEKGIKNSSNFSNFDTNIWTIENGKMPYLRAKPVVFTETLNINSTSDHFIGDVFDYELTVNPSLVTYDEKKYTFSRQGVIEVMGDNKIKAVGKGHTMLTIEALDGSHAKVNIDIIVYGDELKNLEDNYIRFKDQTSIENIKGTYNIDGLEITVEGEEFIGTNKKIIYKLNGNKIKEYIAIVKGDVTGDGKVASSDMLLIKRHILQISTLGEVEQLAANISGRGISSANLLLMKRYILGIEGEL